MIIGIGIDIAEVERFFDKDKDERFLSKIYNENEKKYILKKQNPYASLASHFAAKEAFLKALGAGMGYGFSTLDFEIKHDEKGKPIYQLSDKVLSYFNTKNVKAHLSISHEKHYAVAVCVLESF